MNPNEDYLEVNKKAWNKKTDTHFESNFYNVEGFLKGESSLNDIELPILGNIEGKSILHLQCHFGQDSISLSRMGAKVTGVDLSDTSIEKAKDLAKKCGTNTEFICSDIYDLPSKLNETFDIVYTSYGTVGWLPDTDKWAAVISKFLKPNGRFIFVEFHPVVWMFDYDFKEVAYNYFNDGPIVESETGTYADRESQMENSTVSWNHPISEVVSSLLSEDLQIKSLKEYDYSPYDCFNHTKKIAESKYRIKHLDNKVPMVYSIEAIKNT